MFSPTSELESRDEDLAAFCVSICPCETNSLVHKTVEINNFFDLQMLKKKDGCMLSKINLKSTKYYDFFFFKVCIKRQFMKLKWHIWIPTHISIQGRNKRCLTFHLVYCSKYSYHFGSWFSSTMTWFGIYSNQQRVCLEVNKTTNLFIMFVLHFFTFSLSLTHLHLHIHNKKHPCLNCFIYLQELHTWT